MRRLSPHFVVVGVLTALASFSGLPRASAADTDFAYVTTLGTDTVAVIDTVSDTVVATIAVGGGPFGVAVSPDGSRAYVANAFDGTVSVIDGSSRTVIATITVGPQPLGIAVSPDGTRAYAVSVGDGTGGTVSVINAATNVVTGQISVPGTPTAAAVSASGRCLYVASFEAVLVIDTATNELTVTIPLEGAGSDSIAVAPAAPFGYVVNAPSGDIAILNLASNRVLDTVSIQGNVQAVAVSPDARRVYATDSSRDEVVVLDGASHHIIQRISLPTGSNPIGISLTPDGTKAYVANNGSGSVAVIATHTNTLQTSISVAGNPYAKGQFIPPALLQRAPQSSRCTED